MSINVNDKNLGHATAYAYYKAGGGTMTEAEFTEFMADFGTASQTAVEAAQAALASETAARNASTTATNKATEATTAAATATTKAGEASTSASTATSAKDTAVSASQTATTKATEATTAAATATSAATTATTAKDDAVSAKTAAQTAQTGAETAAASVEASAEQIATNAEDISQLKSDLSALIYEKTFSVIIDLSNVFPCEFKAGETYVISTNARQGGVRTLAADKSTTIDYITSEFTADTSMIFVPTADAYYLRVWGVSNGIITVECTSAKVPLLESAVEKHDVEINNLQNVTNKCATLTNMANNHSLSSNTYFQCKVADVSIGDELYVLFNTNCNDSAQAYNFQCRNYTSSPSNVVRSSYIGDGLFFIKYDVIDANNLQLLVWPTTELTLYGVTVGINGKYLGDDVYVDGTTGDDNSDGVNALFPKKTITSALEVGNNIIVTAGVYEESIKIQNKCNIRISRKADSNDSNYLGLNRVIIRNPQTKFTFAIGSSGLYECPYSAFGENSNMYKVFVTHTLDPITDAGGGTGNAYNATIFKYDGTHASIALKPVLTLAECQAEADTFFWDGSTIYLNTETYNGYTYMSAIDNQVAFYAESCDGLELNGLQFEMGYGTDVRLATISKSHNCKVIDCVGLLCAGRTNFYIDSSDVDFVKCQSYRSATDGYAPVRSGNCNFYDCIGAYNKDDGVSHHQATCGVINGGEYHHNGKGGVASPTHGAHVDIYNVYTHDNRYGIYAVSASDIPTMPIKMFNNVVGNNNQAVAISNYVVYGYNNKFTGNTSDGNINAITNL